MSKAGAIAALGVGGSGAAITTAYLSGAFGGNYDASLPDSLETFKGQAGEAIEGCVLDLFPGIENMKDEQGVDEVSSEIGSNFFTTDNNKKISGCLVVNWDKGETSRNSGKWKGNFRFLWAVKQENKGFITFAKASEKEESSTKKLGWEGIIYEVNFSDNKWKKSNKQTIDKKQEGKDLSTKFPKANSKLEKIDGKSFWDFMTTGDETEMNKACGTSDTECQTLELSNSFKGYWTWEGSSNNSSGTELGGWTENLSTWWDDLFPAKTGSSNRWKMGDVVKDKKGTWSNKKIIWPSKAAETTSQK